MKTNKINNLLTTTKTRVTAAVCTAAIAVNSVAFCATATATSEKQAMIDVINNVFAIIFAVVALGGLVSIIMGGIGLKNAMSDGGGGGQDEQGMSKARNKLIGGAIMWGIAGVICMICGTTNPLELGTAVFARFGF